LPNNIGDLYIEEKLKTDIAGRIVVYPATIHAAIVGYNAENLSN
jgi:hypothetical protein